MTFIACDTDTLVKQIGANILAISGGRFVRRETGISLPVGAGYFVEVDLTADDLYLVRRVFRRGAKVWEKGRQDRVFADEIAEVAYVASCFRNRTFGGHAP